MLLAVMGAGQLFPIGGQIALSWAAQAALYAVLTLQVIELGRRDDLPAATRRFWRQMRITTAVSVFTAGCPLLVNPDASGTSAAVPPLVHDLSGALAVSVMAWSCLTYRTGNDTLRRRVRRWLDAGSLLVGGTGILWYFEAGPMQSEHVGTTSVFATVFLDALALIAVLSFLQPITSDVRPIGRRAGLWAVGAIISGCMTEALLPAALHTRWLGPVVLLRLASPLCAVIAVRYQRDHLHDSVRPATRSRRIYSRAPYVSIALTYLLFALALGKIHVDLRTWGMFAAATGVTAFVVARQLTAFADNARLVRDLTTSVRRADDLAAELHQHAFYDGLTGLPNRMLFTDRVSHALAAQVRTDGDLAVLVVDLDDFKLVNDRCGHQAGDDVLREAADRLRGAVRAGDTVARLGGDEFAILVPEADHDCSSAVAARIVAAFERPFTVGDGTAELGVSVGVTLTCSSGDNDVASLLRNADIAMYEAKTAGKRRYAMFATRMLDSLVNRHDTKQALTRAIAEDELVVYYQPIVDAADGHVRGVEALVRWVRPGHGMVPPLEFLSLAEQVGLIPDIDLFVLQQACRQVQGWNSHRAPGELLTVHVNMSAVTLAAPDVVMQVTSALDASGLPPAQLTVELTESALMADPRAVIARMEALRETGVRLAIDDFGTGYSSLAYLRDLPVDTVKVDKSFVDRILGEEVDRELVRTIVSLAGRLGLDTVAEGVEGQEQAMLLSSLGCARMQGFLFSRPMPADQLEVTGEQVSRAAAWLQAAVVESVSSDVTVPVPR